MNSNLSFEAMPQNIAALSEQVSGLSASLSELKSLIGSKKLQPQAEAFIGVDEACEIVHLAKSTLYKLCNKSEIPHYKPAKELLFRKSELIAWVERSHNKGAQSVDEIMAELSRGNRRKPSRQGC